MGELTNGALQCITFILYKAAHICRPSKNLDMKAMTFPLLSFYGHKESYMSTFTDLVKPGLF